MSPAYQPWQLAIIDKTSSQLNVGDVIVFRCTFLNATLIKRIAACPGDTVEIKNGILYINGDTVQTIPSYNSIGYAGIAESPIKLNEDEYFVLGDNLEYSKDSRHADIGCISKDEILGRIFPQIPISK